MGPRMDIPPNLPGKLGYTPLSIRALLVAAIT
jgi:hypothetical protein